MVIPPIMGILLVDIYIYGRWFQLKNMKVSWDYYSKYMGKTCSKKNAHMYVYIYIHLFLDPTNGLMIIPKERCK